MLDALLAHCSMHRSRPSGSCLGRPEAVVYRVVDNTTGRKLALKRLLEQREGERQEHIAELFEREFYTLAQLAHPRVVAVYDFGKDESAGSYYTMELLDGGDLRELSPLPWQRACSLLVDICSVLSLLHSRGLIHRDLTPRNVRCTQDFKAKLIDFGAMVPMGPCKQLMGTPAFTAPEMVALQSLDARADLYSLGATLYHALTGRQAYPARSFDDLRNAWRSRPRPPSNFVEDIPGELDNLVLSLIDLDLMGRPVNAAEVMERLSAIAGVEVDEQLWVSRAYLSTPTLVGRDANTLRVRKHMMRALRGHGGTVMIEGAPGVGRTRFLDACVLESKLAGATVLRSDASDAQAGAWSAVRTMANQLLGELPQRSLEAARPHAPVLGHVLPGLLDRFEEGEINLETFADTQQLRPRAQAALRDWLLKVSEQRCLVLAKSRFSRYARMPNRTISDTMVSSTLIAAAMFASPWTLERSARTRSRTLSRLSIGWPYQTTRPRALTTNAVGIPPWPKAIM